MREGCLATAYFPEEDSISSFRFGCKPAIKQVSNLKLRIIIQVFGLLAPQRIYTSSAESLSLLRAVARRNTRGLCTKGTLLAVLELKRSHLHIVYVLNKQRKPRNILMRVCLLIFGCCHWFFFDNWPANGACYEKGRFTKYRALLAGPLSVTLGLHAGYFLTKCYFILANFTTIFFIVQRHGSMTPHDYITQNDQFFLTSLPFNKRPVLPELFWVM
jgi:hypothetical protein